MSGRSKFPPPAVGSEILVCVVTRDPRDGEVSGTDWIRATVAEVTGDDIRYHVAGATVPASGNLWCPYPVTS